MVRRVDRDRRGRDVPDGQHRSSVPAWCLAVLLVAMTFAAYWPAAGAGYLWDDNLMLYDNPLIRAGDGLRRIWLEGDQFDYWPLTSTTLWVEWRLWGDNPRPYHVTNIALHALAAVLLWRVLLRLGLGGPGAFLGAAIFAVHPVTVASVAWITERKNVLPMGLSLLAILWYLRFEESGRWRWLLLGVAAAGAALLGKTSGVMLPVVLLVLAWWRRGRVTRRDMGASIPFFVLSLALGLVTVWFQHRHAIAGGPVRPEGWASRVAASGWIVWFYLYKLVAPAGLAMVYPRWEVDGGRIASFVPLALLAACFVVLWTCRARWARGPLAALTCYVALLAPVLGFVDMSFMQYSLVADHLQYAAIPAMAALAGGALAATVRRAWAGRSVMRRAGAVAGAGGVVVVLAVLTWRHARVFRDEASLWDHNIRVNDRAFVAYNNRGNALADRGLYELAVEDFTRCLALKPDYAEAYNNRGNAHGAQGDYDGAIRDLTAAIALKPDYVSAYNNRGNAYACKGDFERAIRDYGRAIELAPQDGDAYYNRGRVFSDTGDPLRAIADFTRVIALRPELAAAYGDRAAAYLRLGQPENARRDVARMRQLGAEPDAELARALGEAAGRSP